MCIQICQYRHIGEKGTHQVTKQLGQSLHSLLLLTWKAYTWIHPSNWFRVSLLHGIGLKWIWAVMFGLFKDFETDLEFRHSEKKNPRHIKRLPLVIGRSQGWRQSHLCKGLGSVTEQCCWSHRIYHVVCMSICNI